MNLFEQYKKLYEPPIPILPIRHPGQPKPKSATYQEATAANKLNRELAFILKLRGHDEGAYRRRFFTTRNKAVVKNRGDFLLRKAEHQSRSKMDKRLKALEKGLAKQATVAKRKVEERQLEEKTNKLFGDLFANPVGDGIKSRRKKKKHQKKKKRSRKRGRSKKRRRSN